MGFIAAIAEFMIDGPRFCSRFQFGRLLRSPRPTHHALPPLSAGRASAFFALGVAWLGPASDQLRIAVGRIFRQHICLFRVKTSFWVRQTDGDGGTVSQCQFEAAATATASDAKITSAPLVGRLFYWQPELLGLLTSTTASPFPKSGHQNE